MSEHTRYGGRLEDVRAVLKEADETVVGFRHLYGKVKLGGAAVEL
jgi:hypothetical protein